MKVGISELYAYSRDLDHTDSKKMGAICCAFALRCRKNRLFVPTEARTPAATQFNVDRETQPSSQVHVPDIEVI